MEEEQEERAAYYRQRATELRAVAVTTRGTGSRLALLSLAKAYEKMAGIAHGHSWTLLVGGVGGASGSDFTRERDNSGSGRDRDDVRRDVLQGR